MDCQTVSVIGLNTALMEGGDLLFDKQEYVRALVLYRMVRLKDELMPLYKKQAAALKASLAAAAPWVPLEERARQDEDRHSGQSLVQNADNLLFGVTLLHS